MARKSIEMATDGYIRTGGLNSLVTAARGMLSVVVIGVVQLASIYPRWRRRGRR